MFKLASLYRWSNCKNLWSARAGNYSILTAILSVPFIVSSGAAIDVAVANSSRLKLQEAADAAALHVAQSAGGALSEIGSTRRMALSDEGLGFVRANTKLHNVRATISFDEERDEVVVKSEYSSPNNFLGVLGFASTPVSAVAAAKAGRSRELLCILALSEADKEALDFRGASNLRAEPCAVQSNSKAPTSISRGGSGSSLAGSFCAVGGVSSPKGKLSPEPATGCKAIADPFAGLAMPASGPCTFVRKAVPKGISNLAPGRFCEGLSLSGTVELAPGNYIIDNGDLKITAQAKVSGKGVTFLLVGPNSSLDVMGGAELHLKAPASGTYGGMLIVQAPSVPAGTKSKITGGATLSLDGVIYMPTANLTLSGNGNVGENSPGLAVVVDTLSMGGTGDLFIRTDFAAAGFEGTTAHKALSKERSPILVR